MGDINDITERMQGVQLNTQVKHKLNYIKGSLRQYPKLNLELDPNKIYNSSAILKDGTWDEFINSVRVFLENKNIEYTASQSSRSSRLPQSSRSSRLPQSGRVASTSVEPGIKKGGKKSRRNTRRRKYSKKQKPSRKQTHRHRHRHRRSRHRR
jgi:hypothetical protein